jgi:HNH endonuclease
MPSKPPEQAHWWYPRVSELSHRRGASYHRCPDCKDCRDDEVCETCYGAGWISSREFDPWGTRELLPVRASGSRPTRVRNAVIARDQMVCQICHKKVQPEDLHLDHFEPVVAGGTNDADNLRVTHARCNLHRERPNGFNGGY